jgi:hypothetical protein
MQIHTRSVAHKVFEVWRSPGRFTKNPDLVQLPFGRLLFVYADNDAHWPLESEVLTFVASDDVGRTWYKFGEVARAVQPQDERLVTPRLSRLSDGRLVVLCDHDDYQHFHEEQPSGNWAWWSNDGGVTWSGHHVTGIEGFEPDRIVELPDGTLGAASHLMLSETQCHGDILSVSEDGGKTWSRRSIIAADGHHFFCEGAIVRLGGHRLACVMRENHSAGIPSFVAFSEDCGHTWSPPQMCPFALHRPYAKKLADGRVLVTGRHVNGGLGTYAWCGSLAAEAGRWVVGGPRGEFAATLTSDALVITNQPQHECRYTMLPAESSRSDVLFEAALRVNGAADEPAAFLSVSTHQWGGGPLVLLIAPRWIGFSATRPDKKAPVDMTRERTVAIRHRRGLVQVVVDGQVILSGCCRHDVPIPQDFWGGRPDRRTQFGQLGERGTSWWSRVRYEVRNPTFDDTVWEWQATSREWPDQYQRDRLIQIHANDPDQKPSPDNGYSSWVILDDGRVLFVDYTNCGDEPNRSHIVGAYLEPEDLA